MGLTEPRSLDSDEVIQVVEERKSSYRKLIVRDGRPIGARMMVGDAEASANLVQFLSNAATRSPRTASTPFCSPDAGDGGGASTDRQDLQLQQGQRDDDRRHRSSPATARSPPSPNRPRPAPAFKRCGSCKGLLAQLIERHAEPGSKNGRLAVVASVNGS